MPVILRLTAALLLVTLAACRGVPERADNASSWLAERQAFFAAHPHWQASGRMAIRDGGKGISVNFDWINQGDQFELRLRSSGGRWVMHSRPGFAELEGTRIGYLQADSAEPLVEQALGWSVPVAYLQSWMRALPAPPDARISFAGDGSVLEINHQAWRIGYQTYAQIELAGDIGLAPAQSGSLLLPTRLDAGKDQYNIKVLISDWQL